jgi:hypothetical protein
MQVIELIFKYKSGGDATWKLKSGGDKWEEKEAEKTKVN